MVLPIIDWDSIFFAGKVMILAETAAKKISGIGENFFKMRTLMGFAISAVIIAIFLKNFDLGAAARSIQNANWLLLLPALVIFYISLPLRGARWGMLLKASGTEIDNRSLSHYYFLSWFANALLPARIGDVYRAFLLKKNKNVPVSFSLGIIFSERVMDLAVTAILVVLSGSYYWTLIKNLKEKTYIIWGLAAVAAVVAMFVAMQRYLPLLIKYLPGRWKERAGRFEAGIFKSPSLLPVLLVMTAAIWLTEAMRLYFVFLAFGVKSGFLMAVFISQAALILMSIPLSPAGLGLVELLMLALLSSGGITLSLAGAITLIDRLISYWSLLACGGMVYFFSPRVR